MKKKIVLGLVTIGLVAGSTFAYAGDCPSSSKYKKNMQHSDKMYKSGKYGDKMSHSMSYRSKNHRDYLSEMFKRLDLSKKQRFEISILRDEMKLDFKKLRGFGHKNKMGAYIGDNGFDVAAYKKDMSSMSAKMISIRADYMGKMFKVLTKEQIAQLKKNLAK